MLVGAREDALRGSVNVPHLKMHLSDAGTVNVCNPLHCIMLQSAIVKSSVPVCVLAMWADWKDICTLVYHVPSCLLHPPCLFCFLCSHLNTTRNAVEFEFVQSACYVRV